jgi:hypothetical protein
VSNGGVGDRIDRDDIGGDLFSITEGAGVVEWWGQG